MQYEVMTAKEGKQKKRKWNLVCSSVSSIYDKYSNGSIGLQTIKLRSFQKRNRSKRWKI